MADQTYQCHCHNGIALVDARFRCYDSSGNDAHEVTVPTGGDHHLNLVQETGNTVLVEYWDAGSYSHDSCYSVNNGDHISVVGLSNGFQVSINGNNAPKIDCPKS
jgi:hypothetical protein